MDTATIMPQRHAAPDAIHPLSHHPVVRRLIEAGPDKEWSSGEVAGLLGLSERAVQLLAADGRVGFTTYPTRAAHGRKPGRLIRRFTTHSLLVYVLQYSTEVSEADVLAAWGMIVQRLPLGVLERLQTALAQGIERRRRSKAPVVCVAPAGAGRQAAESAAQGVLDLFSGR